MVIVAQIVGAAAAICWLVAVWSGLQMVRRRAPGVTLSYLATHGVAFFDARHFTADAAPWRRRFNGAFAAFFVCLFVAIGVGAAAGR